MCLALQQDITRGRDMVDSLYQGGQGMGSGTHNPIMSSEVRAHKPLTGSMFMTSCRLADGQSLLPLF